MMKRDDTYYKAMLARDARFDGKFFVGVKTTGVYCRPICPAKPNRENVEFFSNYLEAEKAGYRPCMRCRPESAPQSPAWIGTSAIVQRAVRALQNAESMNLNEADFAERFGVTARHLRRLFVDEVGKTPKQLMADHRLNLARQLIVETQLPMTDIAFAAGFRSIRRFNAAFKDRFKKKPSDMRRSPANDNKTITINLSYRPPYNFQALHGIYQAHRKGDLEWFDDGKISRVIHYHGKSGIITMSNDPENSCIRLEIDFPDTSMIHVIIARVRQFLDLDSDPVIVANALEIKPIYKKMLKAHAGLRLPSGWSPFEVAIATILGQLVSMGQARNLVQQLIDIAGFDSGLVHDGRPIKLFPTAEQILKADLSKLKTTRIRRQTILEFTRAIHEGRVSLESTQDVDQFIKQVTSIHGIGRWTADYMALKVLRNADTFPATDLVLARVLKQHPMTTVNKMSPWRGYAAILFWLEYSEGLNTKDQA